MTSNEIDELLDFHNKVRKEVGVDAVKWNPKVAQSAQQWADYLAETGKFEHRPADNSVYGSNLAAGTGSFTVLSLAGLWYGEKANYKLHAPIGNDLKLVGHYTQMIWKNTTEIGVGKATYKTGERKGQSVIVAEYNPPGNYIGQDPLAPTSK